MSPENAVEQLVRQALADGRKIEAIKIYREATGVGLAEAKHAVEAIEHGESTSPASAPADLDKELLRLLRDGQKIEAVKRHRERTNSGLKESKDYVESLAARHRVAVPRVGCLGMLLGIAVTIGVFALLVAT